MIWKLLPIIYYILPNFVLVGIYGKSVWELWYYLKDRQIKKRLDKMTPSEIDRELREYNYKNYENLFSEETTPLIEK